MSQHERQSDDESADDPDPWFDLPDETDEPLSASTPMPLALRSVADRATDRAALLLDPLAAAADALARLDAQAAVLSPSLQEGLIARLAFADAAGWLAAQGLTVHLTALALRETERLGGLDLYARVRTAASGTADPWWSLEEAVPPALHLVRLLRRPGNHDPLLTVDQAQVALGFLGRDGTAFDVRRHQAWRGCCQVGGPRSRWHPDWMTTSPNPYRGFRFPAEIIEHAVWLYHCFSLSLRDVETILAAVTS